MIYIKYHTHPAHYSWFIVVFYHCVKFYFGLRAASTVAVGIKSNLKIYVVYLGSVSESVPWVGFREDHPGQECLSTSTANYPVLVVAIEYYHQPATAANFCSLQCTQVFAYIFWIIEKMLPPIPIFASLMMISCQWGGAVDSFQVP